MSFFGSKSRKPDPKVEEAQKRAEERAEAAEAREKRTLAARSRVRRTGGMRLLMSPQRMEGPQQNTKLGGGQ